MKALISPLAIAPMVDWTYTHCRVFMRILASKALLYTDMHTVGALFNNPRRVLDFESMEKPLALQLGGSDADKLRVGAQQAEAHDFDEINLNLGCPSDRVQSGGFGACLMSEPKTVVSCIRAMKQGTVLPVTAKLRLGIDHEDSYEFFSSFAYQLVDAGCDKLIVHARKAWLQGLSPKENRTVPPVQYEFVYRLKESLPTVPVVINGNIQDLLSIQTHLQYVDGVMLGRLACQNPYEIALIHHALFPDDPLISRVDALKQYAVHVQAMSQRGIPLSVLLKPILNLAHGLPSARLWKAKLLNIKPGEDVFGWDEALSLLNSLEKMAFTADF